ncbi:MAG: hypothetical protein HFJ50_02810 [Clostridia bacterium]|jgi:hypothetical protein|nr:hypothetical protein [Clostridia bacterium]
MKNKVIFSFIIVTILLVGFAFANSYVKALTNQEKLEMLEQEAQNNEYNNLENETININNICNNYCWKNEECPIYKQNSDCVNENNHCLQKNHHYKRNCNNREMCNI